MAQKLELIPTPATLPLTLPVVVAILATTLFAYYRSILKRPLPGIPYNKDAVGTIFGDITALMAYKKEHGSGRLWMLDQLKQHNSVLMQIFIKPFSSRPAIILADVSARPPKASTQTTNSSRYSIKSITTSPYAELRNSTGLRPSRTTLDRHCPPPNSC